MQTTYSAPCDREQGHYWVQHYTNGDQLTWTIAKWNGRWWELPGCTFASSDKEFISINENQIPAPTNMDMKIPEAAHFYSQGNLLYAAHKLGFIKGAYWYKQNAAGGVNPESK